MREIAAGQRVVVDELEPEPVVPEVPLPELVVPEPVVPELPMPELLVPELPIPDDVLDEPLAPMPELLVLLPGDVLDVLALGVLEYPPLDVRVLLVDWQPAASAAAASATPTRVNERCKAIMVLPS